MYSIIYLTDFNNDIFIYIYIYIFFSAFYYNVMYLSCNVFVMYRIVSTQPASISNAIWGLCKFKNLLNLNFNKIMMIMIMILG